MASRKFNIGHHSHVVIGSGPAGVACAAGLIRRGLDVVMLDVGVRPEEEALTRKETLARTSPDRWNPDDVRALKEPVNASLSGVLKKLVYGSDFAYGDPYHLFAFRPSGTKSDFSFALGGLSNAWGACMLPVRQEDVMDWPITSAELAHHYEAVLRFVPLTAWNDHLADLFPIFTSKPVSLQNGIQASDILRQSSAHRLSLERAGIYVANPRLAVHAQSAYAADGCSYCGLCMYGCPYELIYKSHDSLSSWISSGSIRYYNQLLVEQVKEYGAVASIYALDLETGQQLDLECARIYLAAGTIPTTKILLESLSRFDSPILAKDSQMFLTPIFKTRSTPGFSEDKQFTLSQLFLELIGSRKDEESVHFQIYPFTDLISKALRRFFPASIWESSLFRRQVLSRLMIMQGFLSSKDSATLEFTLRKHPGRNILEMRGIPNSRTAKVVRDALWRVAGKAGKIGAFAVPFFPRLGLPGQSFHSGGSFPMSVNPTATQSDLLGRVPSFDRVHAVDASVLPTIPATTITLTVMANAHRVASLSPER